MHNPLTPARELVAILVEYLSRPGVDTGYYLTSRIGFSRDGKPIMAAIRDKTRLAVELMKMDPRALLALALEAGLPVPDSIPVHRSGAPWLVELLGYLVPRRVRLRFFEPAFNDLLRDYYEAKQTFRSVPARAALIVCLVIQTVLLVCQCTCALKEMVSDTFRKSDKE